MRLVTGRGDLSRGEFAGCGEWASQFLVEDFVPGPEVALEGLLVEGGLQVLAIRRTAQGVTAVVGVDPAPLRPLTRAAIVVTPGPASGGDVGRAPAASRFRRP